MVGARLNLSSGGATVRKLSLMLLHELGGRGSAGHSVSLARLPFAVLCCVQNLCLIAEKPEAPNATAQTTRSS